MSAFVIWSLVAAALVFWALRFGVSSPQAPAYAVPIDRAAPPRGDLARAVRRAAGRRRGRGSAAGGAVALPPGRRDGAALQPPEGNGAYGLALIAVDGKPPRAFAVGAKLDTDLVLQSVGLRTASLGTPQGARSVLLELPALPAPATGTLPAPAAGAGRADVAGGAARGRAGAGPPPAMAPAMPPAPRRPCRCNRPPSPAR